MTAPLAFVDLETTGLDPDRHEIWEIGLILRLDGADMEYAWQLPVDLSRADPMGLRVGRFYERRRKIGGMAPVASLHRVKYPTDEQFAKAGPLPVSDTAETIANLLDGCHLVGAVPSFDAAFLGPWLRSHGQAATWHYHLVDVEALAAGWLAAGHDLAFGPPVRDKCQPPWNSNELSAAVGVDPEQFDRHTALGDARWARAIYDAVMGGLA